MLLKQQGKISYDDTLGKFFPGITWHHITIENLLTHRAGLDKYTNICDNYYRERKVDPPTDFNNDSVIVLMQRMCVRALREPDKRFDYSNTGYVVLAKIVEKVSGVSFSDFMQANFFIPLGMQHTWINTDKQVHPGKTRGYYKNWVYWQDDFLDGVSGDKGVYASVGDMYKWDRALKEHTILNKEILDAPVLVYTKSTGLYAGVTVKGGHLSRSDSANFMLYNTRYTLPELLYSDWVQAEKSAPEVLPLMKMMRDLAP